jgi:hypothetical protein
MEDIRVWIEYNITYLKKKVVYMKEHVPNHRNIGWFEGQLVAYEKMLNYIDELPKTIDYEKRDV